MRFRRSLPVIVSLTTGVAAAAFAVPGPAGAAQQTAVQMGQRVCAAARPGTMSCLAIRLVTKRVSVDQAKKLEALGLARPVSVRPSVNSGPAGGYSPGQLARAYGVKPGASTRQTVAIVDAFNDPTVRADLNKFDSHYGLPRENARSLRVVNEVGGSKRLPRANVAWAGEITLDVQVVRGLCHRCRILLVEASSASNRNLGRAVDYAAAHAKIVSNSYGSPEFRSDPQVRHYNHPGVAILAASGDDGWYGWDHVNAPSGSSDNAPTAPASYRTVIGVGGTTLKLNPNGTRISESVYNDNGRHDSSGMRQGAALGASGSGCSRFYKAQRWQQKVAGYIHLGCGSKRSSVDIAADGDYLTGYDVFENYGHPAAPTCSGPCWSTVGGNSLASPIVAAFWGLAHGPGGVRYPALTLYGHYKSHRRQLHDVRAGGTGFCSQNLPAACFGGRNPNASFRGLVDCAWHRVGRTVRVNRSQCYARAGYDGVSGVGTPRGLNPFKPLRPTALITRPRSIRHGRAASFSGRRSRSPFPGGSITSYRWRWGDGHTARGRARSHTYARRGTYRVTLTVRDTYTSQNNGRVGRKTITIRVR